MNIEAKNCGIGGIKSVSDRMLFPPWKVICIYPTLADRGRIGKQLNFATILTKMR
jgi:hypothetical protein